VTGAFAQAKQCLSEAQEKSRLARAASREAVSHLQAAKTTLAQRQERKAVLGAELEDAPTPEDVEKQFTEVTRLEQAVVEADRLLENARQQVEAATKAEQRVEHDAAQAWQVLARARDPLVRLGAPALAGEALLVDWSTLVHWATAEASRRETELNAAIRTVDDLGGQLRLAEQALLTDLTDHDIPFDPATSTDLVEAVPVLVATAAAEVSAAYTTMEERHRTAQAMAGDIKAEREKAQVAKQVADLLRSNNFPRWLVSSALDTLVAAASASLMELSGGQFELSHSEGDFLVVDHNEADTTRSVKTLSGGETFQASLALALALSTHIGPLAEAGAARLDAIFLDEGFGALDESTLETVAVTLESLAGSGSRMVGIITHVAALAERVPVRFQVSRDATGSHIVREGA
jgi:exonuclease SbcC